MKVSKIISENNGGCFIQVEIGHKGNQSYWSAPSKSVDHADLGYLRDRYCIINTEKRAAEFKRQYKNLWVEITPCQTELMKHAMGLGRSKKPYRNYFFTQESDKDWNELVEKGLAFKSTRHPNNDEFVYFYLTKQGVEIITGKKIRKKEYEDL
ncbi:hypothetical protein KTC96_24930 (plasmid) [Clostridium estertheticum]|uniref:hypothetical protein n=1 Tax=Clostridium estertheticum TaxID=238834 RepID=UPI001C7D88FE|nr:hypothetical protein [Clostridium estertheticum]MBX4259774.1 hypothetical protein [Clostridium estertheticum]WLC73267.1 hypothetical protein KTC96_24930 [Clostridium estertheticum]